MADFDWRFYQMVKKVSEKIFTCINKIHECDRL